MLYKGDVSGNQGQVKLAFVSILIDSYSSYQKKMLPNGSSMPQITDPFVHLTNRTVQRRSGAQKLGKKDLRGVWIF